jgi:acetylornithine/succinyldiaminopimelate/putrescine aminotransferase
VVGGKSAGGGFPVAFVAGRPDLLDNNPRADYPSTFSANPMACLALEATIKFIREEGLLQNVRDLSPLIEDACAHMVLKGRANAYHGRGYAYALHLDDVDRARGVVADARSRGFLLMDTFRGTIKIVPPLVITTEDLDTGLGIIKASLAAVGS